MNFNTISLSWECRPDILLQSRTGYIYLGSNYRVALINQNDDFKIIYLPFIYNKKEVLLQ